MFRYQEPLAKYISDRRIRVIEKNIGRIENIKTLTNIFCKSDIIKELTYAYIGVVERCTNEIYETPSSSTALLANLRLLFETCITIRLLIAEEGYKYKVRYSIYRHQFDKSKALRECANFDLRLLNELESSEEEIKEHLSGLENISAKLAEIGDLYDALDEEISIFLDNAEFNGAGYHKHFISRYLDEHQKREDVISLEWEKVKDLLISDPKAVELFDFRGQKTRVESELRDTRTWQNKAIEVGLSEMYKFIYDYTSSMIHSTSYSSLVPNQLDQSEITMILSLSTRLCSDILKNLKVFSGIPDMQVINVNDQ